VYVTELGDYDADAVASHRWTPSMLRLYQPTSVLHLAKENQVSVSDFMINGLQQPAMLASSTQLEIDENVIHKLRCCIGVNSGAKRVNVRRRKKELSDKAIEVHERV